jgi:hypothetical protein
MSSRRRADDVVSDASARRKPATSARSDVAFSDHTNGAMHSSF